MRTIKYHLVLTDNEYSLIINSLNNLRNDLITQGRYTDAVDDVLHMGEYYRNINLQAWSFVLHLLLQHKHIPQHLPQVQRIIHKKQKCRISAVPLQNLYFYLFSKSTAITLPNKNLSTFLKKVFN